jgi:hypothetical protein
MTAGDNLVANAGFERDYWDYVAMWNYEAYDYRDEAVIFKVLSNEGHSGNRCMAIANLLPNDAKVIQWVKVEPNSYYKLSGWVKGVALDETQPIGANISVLGLLTIPPKDYKNTGTTWQYLELFGKTGPRQNEIAIVCRLGFYGSLLTGTAYFDDINLVKVSQVPSETQLILDFFNEDESHDLIIEQKDSENTLTFFIILTVILIVIALIIVLLVFLHYKGILTFSFRRFGIFGSESASFDVINLTSETKDEKFLNRRKHKRIQKEFVVQLKKFRGKNPCEEMEFKGTDISEGGIFIESDDLSIFEINEQIEITISDQERSYNIGKACVVRKQKSYKSNGILVNSGFGLKFTTLRTRIWKAVVLAG